MRQFAAGIALLLGFAASATATPTFQSQVASSGSGSSVSSISTPSAITPYAAGDLLIVAFEGNATDIVNNGISISDTAGNTWGFGGFGANYQNGTITLASTTPWVVSGSGSSSSVGATGLTLAAAWATPAYEYLVFSDGESRLASFTNGSTAVTWTGALTGSATTTVNYPTTQAVGWYYAANAKSSATTVTITDTRGAGLNAIVVQDFSGVATSSPLLATSQEPFNQQNNTGSYGSNYLTSGSMSFSSSNALLWGLTMDITTATPSGISAGTGFTAQSALWSTGPWGALTEYKTASASAAATFTNTSATEYDNHVTIGAVFSAYALPAYSPIPSINYIVGSGTNLPNAAQYSLNPVIARANNGNANFSSTVTYALTATVDSPTISGYVAGTTNRIEVSPSASGYILEGLTSTGSTTIQDGFSVLIVNDSGSYSFSLGHEASGTSANQFICPSATNFTVPAYGEALVTYNAALGGWQVK